MPASLKKFEAVFPALVEDLRKQCCEQYQLPIEVWQWFEKSLVHNTMGGKCNRGLSVIDTIQLLLGRDLTKEEYFQSATLGWMIELLQGMMLVLDDIMDVSETRRGQPCWYRMPEVGMTAVNDGPMLESAIYVLLRKYFRNHPAYIDMLELIHEVTLQVELGQCCDMLTVPSDQVNLDNFNLERYTQIMTYKTSYYSFYLSVALSLLYTSRATPLNLSQAKDILTSMGEYFQIQDDYLDNFADPMVLGKIGTDIQDNKCSWLVNQALKRCTPEQRKVLEENYGRKHSKVEEYVTKIKELYDQMGLERAYLEYDERKVVEIRSRIEEVDESQGLKKNVFEEFLKKIYKRSK
ncbi:uncharacterized protein N7483_011522 [Penicillium malachiteum]|uniref:uncharacterized protein n=1 Tax=Penicillium malachiteum TaxID=1324776 RepID=UPI002549B432|nr:uncharacterized protein N7483_011522 [Penicillium malachiteum]KAJ5714341.1 hypothetical protein N7483_011522 [Penicillium malachiteum]